jgi:hypothetical protein
MVKPSADNADFYRPYLTQTVPADSRLYLPWRLENNERNSLRPNVSAARNGLTVYSHHPANSGWPIASNYLMMDQQQTVGDF